MTIHIYELSKLNAEQRSRLLRRAEVAIDELIDMYVPLCMLYASEGMRH